MNANGLSETTRFYPGIIHPVEYDHVYPTIGYLGRQLPELRAAMHRAFGIGTGTCMDPGALAGSRRGRIVTLRGHVADDLRTRSGVLFTEPAYSRAKRYQVLIPILHGHSVRERDGLLVVQNKEWFRALGNTTNRVGLPVHLIQSVWYPADIAAETRYVIDEPTLERIETELCSRFELTRST